MADDIATLKIEVTADGVAKVTSDLDALNDAAKNTQDRNKQTSKSFLGLSASATKTAASLARLAGIGSVGAAFVMVSKSAAKFETAMAEVATLTNSMDMDGLADSVRNLAQAYGQDTITNAKGLYQIISAGASTAAEATATLDAANKLAIGGMTDVATAADGLTSALNAYGLAGDQASDVSDMMFTAMKAGKTTIGELSENIGKLAPIASQAGVALHEILAATAAVTKSGLDTSMTMNSIRQVISNVIKPTKEAADVAKALGLSFNAAALESKGFVGFLMDVQKASGGNTEVLSKLFGSVESLGAIMSLTSKSGAASFANILKDMENRAGATEEAFNKVSETTEFMAGVLRMRLKTELTALGTLILEAVNPALSYMVENFDELREDAILLGKVFGTGILAKSMLALPGLFASIANGATLAASAMKILSAAMLSNPFGLLAMGVATAVSALIMFKDETIQIAGVTGKVSDFIGAAWELTGEKISNAFGGFGDVASAALEYVGGSISGIASEAGAVFDDLLRHAKTFVNNFIRIFHFIPKAIGIIIAAIVDNFKDLGRNILNIFSGIGDGIKNILMGRFDFSKLKKAIYSGFVVPANEVSDAFSMAWKEVEGRDYIGDVVENIQEVSEEVAKLVDEGNKTEEALSEIVVTAQRITPALEDVSSSGRSGAEALALLAATADESKDKLDPFNQALVHTAERIDEAFAGAWEGAFDSFESFADSITNAFKGLLAELAHLAITRPIVMSFTSALGLGTGALAGGAGTGGVGVGGIVSGVSTAYSALTTSLSSAASSLYLNAGGILMNIGERFGIESLSAAGQNSIAAGVDIAGGGAGGWTWGGAAASAGAGIVGGYAGTQVGNNLFNKEAQSGWGATAGATAGAFIGSIIPGIGNWIGAGVGGFIGGLLDSAFGKSKTISNKGARVDLGFGDDPYYNQRGRLPGDEKFSQENYDLVNNIAALFQVMEQALGGSDIEMKLHAGNRRGLRLDGKKYDSVDDLLTDGIEKLIKTATDLDPLLKKLVKGFEGTGEETVAWTLSLSKLLDAMDVSPVEEASKAFRDAQFWSNMTMLEMYRGQKEYLKELIRDFDGTAEAAVALSDAFATSRNLAFEMALAIEAIGAATEKNVDSSIQRMLESVRTPDEQIAWMESEFERLFAALPGMLDPGEIDETTRRLLELNEAILGAGPEELQRANIDTYVQMAETIGQVSAEAQERALNNIEASQERMTDRTETMLQSTADAFKASADKIYDAAEKFEQVVESSGNFNGSEVMV